MSDLAEAVRRVDDFAAKHQSQMAEVKAEASVGIRALETKFFAKFDELQKGDGTPAKLSAIESEVKELRGHLEAKNAQLDALDKIVGNFNQQRAAEVKSLGEAFVSRTEVKDYLQSKQVGNLNGIEVKALDTPTAGGALIRPDLDPNIHILPRETLGIQGLIPSYPTNSNTTEFMRMTTRTNNAAPVVEGDLKPDSDYGFDSVTCPIRLIAHGVPITRVFYDDVAGLRAVIDNELVYGLNHQINMQLLYGDGTGENVTGVMPQATAYSPTGIPTTVTTMVDTIRWAKRQVENSLYQPDTVIMHPDDLAKIDLIKDGNGLYQFSNWRGGGNQQPSVWGLSILATHAMAPGTFLVGALRTKARIRRRMAIELSMTDSHKDYYMRNIYQLRCEARVGLEVLAPDAFVFGSF